jgi:CopG antitoxin of type II toxin-antitoxin system
MKAEEFDTKFDNDEDITEFLDLSQVRRPGYEQKRVNIDFPVWMIEALEKEAKRLGVTSDSIIKLWLAERLDKKVITG